MSNIVKKGMGRIKWIDMAKGITMLLVGIGHYGSADNVVHWIYSFHMALFFFLSGYTLNINTKFIVFLKKKLKSLIFMWIAFLFIYIAYQNVMGLLGVPSASSSFLTIIPRVFLNWRGLYDPIYWFVPALFIAEIIVYWLLKLANSFNKTVILSLTLIVVQYAYLHIFIKNVLPWDLDIICAVMLFIVLGYIAGHYKGEEFKKYVLDVKWIFIPSLALNITFAFLNKGQIDFYLGAFGNYILFVLSAIFGILFVCSLCNLFSLKLLMFIGKNSILFYFIQEYAYVLSSKILSFVPFYSSNNRIVAMILLHTLANCMIIPFVILYNKAEGMIKAKIKSRKVCEI